MCLRLVAFGLARAARAVLVVRVVNDRDLDAFLVQVAGAARGSDELRTLAAKHRDAGDVLVCAWLGRKIVGSTTVCRMWQAEGIPDLFSGGTWVHERLRRLGVGGRMLALALAEARRRSGAPVFANISAENAASLALYRRAGFVVLDEDARARAIEASYIRRVGRTARQVIVRLG